MNKENFISLCAQLSQVGLEGLEYRLLQHICCRPVSFSLTEKREYGTDMLRCQFFFERRSNQYACTYYDAALVREHQMPLRTINEIILQELEKDMLAIDWMVTTPNRLFRVSDETTWAREKSIDEIVGKLTRLSATEDGKVFADTLKVRFWSGTMMEQVLGSLAPVRSKLEASQRFYFFNGGAISLDEAFRFLQNSWIQKMVQLKKNATKTEEDEQVGSSGKSKDGKKRRKAIKKRAQL